MLDSYEEECQIVRKEYIKGDHPGQDLSISLLEHLDKISRHFNTQEEASNVKTNNFILTSEMNYILLTHSII